ncbi:hypothetical protein ATO10_00705 [Actibacterium atlanticum]|uniref:Transmembrane protein n=1 Tax=Actibacterium atlanticum TaxID=1461693 RepID=A0A058ZR01_9RHOB|nr:hypothetical protein [Actibacterium atlanticum]KCV83236.1 hypothetical protein ATO10_00705 [Actibacterium atlanticum]
MFLDIFRSFLRLPLWVQIWVAVVLAPINLAALAFLDAPGGVWIAVLSIGGMLPNVAIMIKERGLSKAMSFPHLVIWVPLVVLVAFKVTTQDLPAGFATYLWALLIIDLVSLGFDFPDAYKWWRGDRDIA